MSHSRRLPIYTPRTYRSVSSTSVEVGFCENINKQYSSCPVSWADAHERPRNVGIYIEGASTAPRTRTCMRATRKLCVLQARTCLHDSCRRELKFCHASVGCRVIGKTSLTLCWNLSRNGQVLRHTRLYRRNSDIRKSRPPATLTREVN